MQDHNAAFGQRHADPPGDSVLGSHPQLPELASKMHGMRFGERLQSPEKLLRVAAILSRGEAYR